jgi:hypothetical protein
VGVKDLFVFNYACVKNIITVFIVIINDPILSAQMQEYNCPYCSRKSASPGGVRFHVKLTHPEKLEEFNAKYYSNMADSFKEEHPSA